MIGAVLYLLCALTALVCAVLLMRAYQRSGYKLLLWSALCFAGLTVNNALMVARIAAKEILAKTAKK